MNVQVTRLANGLRVASHTMPHLGTVAFGLWVASGARHETAREHGMSHLLEHMAFKGTARRTATEIAEEIEQVGGDLNAATSLDTTCYYVRVLKDDVAVALDILADIVQNPRYLEDELERERDVILQEIAATRDSPDDIAYDLIQDAAFTGQALGRPILGTTESVSGFTTADLRSFLAARYRADQMVLSAAGNIEHDVLVRYAEAHFSNLNAGSATGAEPARYIGGPRIDDKPFEQAHVLLGYEGLSFRDPDFYSAQVFAGVFGGGMSSRLFQEVREKRGLCYSIYASAWGLADTGLFSVHAATSQEMLGDLVGVVRDQLASIATDLVTEKELQRSKAQMKAGLLMSLESSSGRAEQMARQILAFDRLLGVDELLEKVESVTRETVRGTVQRLIGKGKSSVVLVGAGRKAGQVASRALEGLGASG